jgi:hypothetical protein
VKRNASLSILLSSSDLGAVQTTGYTNLNSLSSDTLCASNRFLHSATEVYTSLKLERDSLCYELSVAVGLTSLNDAQVNITLNEILELLAEVLDVLALLSDNKAWLRGVDVYLYASRGALDLYSRDTSGLKLVTHELSDLNVFADVTSEILAGEPLRLPTLDNSKSQTFRINFLSHIRLPLPKSYFSPRTIVM